jgi:hypothetical protein
MAPPRRTPAGSSPLSMESSSTAQIMAPNLPKSLIQAPGGAGSFSPLSFPLFWAVKHGPWENEGGGRGLAIMLWPPFVHKKQQPTELCFRRSGWFWGGDATEVGYVGRVLMHRFDRQVTRQKMNKRKCVDANAANKQVEIHDNQLKQSR